MNAKTVSRLALVVVVLALAVAPGTAVAQATRIECTGTEIRQAVPNPGTWEVLPSGNVHGRDMISVFQENSSCPQMAGGLATVTLNANWDAQGYGPMWGSGVITTSYNGGGVWRATWHGEIGPGTCVYEGIGHGISGSVAGLVNFVKADCRETEDHPYTTVTATILLPGQ